MARIAIAAIGRLIRKIEPHQKFSSSQPPISGPSGMPRPVPSTTRATALPRSAGGNRAGRTANATGMIIAPPRPITARAAMRTSTDVVQVAAADAAANTLRPTMSRRLRPYRSPSAPQVRISPASTRM